MKIELTRGCIADNFVVDDKSAADLTSEELLDCCKKVINTIQDKHTLIEEFIECLSIAGEYDEETEDYFFKYNDKEIRLVTEDNSSEMKKSMNPSDWPVGYTPDIYYTYREYLTINGEDMENLSIDDIKNYLMILLENTNSNYNYTILQELTEDLGVIEFIGHCDQCGDDIYTYTIEL